MFVARVIPEEGLDAVRAVCNTDVWEDELPPPRDELLRRVAGCDGVLTLLTDRVDDEFLDMAGPQLKVVSNYAVGFDNVDVAACARRRIPVGNTPGVLTETTADLAFALLMAAARRLPEGDRYVRDGNWRTWGPLLLLGPDVHGATIGIVGFGRIGSRIGAFGGFLGMRVLAWGPTLTAERAAAGGAAYVPLETLLAESDVVSLHTRLSDQTRGLITAPRLALMKPTAYLINTARGPIVDEAALVAALRERRIAGAALDVFDEEPLPAGHPLAALDNVVLTPHLGFVTHEAYDVFFRGAVDNILRWLDGGLPERTLNPEARPLEKR